MQTKLDELLTYQTAANLLQIPVGSLYSMVSRRQIPHLRISQRMVRFSRVQLEEFLAGKLVRASQEVQK